MIKIKQGHRTIVTLLMNLIQDFNPCSARDNIAEGTLQDRPGWGIDIPNIYP